MTTPAHSPAIGGARRASFQAAPAATAAGNPFAQAATAHHTARNGSARKAPVTFTPTAEQAEIRDIFLAGHNMVISAGAGTGKTSTITMLADELYKADRSARGVYIAFNRAIAEEVSGKFFYRNVEGMTFHSLAARGCRANPKLAPLMDKMGRDFKDNLPPWKLGSHFRIPSMKLGADPDQPVHPVKNPALYSVAGNTVGSAALEAITRFCQSADTRIGPGHVPVTKNINKSVRAQYRAQVAAVAQRFWDEDIVKADGVLRFGHDHYLKLWTLTRPDIADLIGIKGRAVLFFDEAQDARPCIADVALSQKKMQVVLCGDSSQAIYRFTGCRDAMLGFKTQQGVKTTSLSKTFRFGYSIAALANTILPCIDNSDVRIIPDLSIPSTVQLMPEAEVAGAAVHADAVICRSNYELIATAVEMLTAGKSVYALIDASHIKALAEDYAAMVAGEKPKTREMKQFTLEKLMRMFGTAATRSAVNDNDSGGDDDDDDVEPEVSVTFAATMRAIVSLGASAVSTAMSRMSPSEEAADIVLSTIHKAKGRQWDSVAIKWNSDMFNSMAGRGENLFNDELMLLYVAVTRARKDLLVSKELIQPIIQCNSFSQALPENRISDALSTNPDMVGRTPDELKAIKESILYYSAINPLVTWLPSFHDREAVDAVMNPETGQPYEAHQLVHAFTFLAERFMNDRMRASSPGGRGGVGRIYRGQRILDVVSYLGIPALLEARQIALDTDLPTELIAELLKPSDQELPHYVEKALDVTQPLR